MTTIQGDIQLLEPGSLLEFFEWDGTPIGGSVVRFHGHNHSGVIVWQGLTYYPWPIKAEGFGRTSGQQPSPKLSVGNVDGSISFLCLAFEDMVGSILTRRRTFLKYIDSINFRRNLLIRTDQFNNSAWHKGNSSIDANGALSPQGGMTMDMLIGDTTNDTHYAWQEIQGAPDNTILSASVVVKEADYPDVVFYLVGRDLNQAELRYTFATATVDGDAPLQPLVQFSAEDLGGGLIRLKIEHWNVMDGAEVPHFDVMLHNGTSPVFVGDDVSGTWVGNAHIERADAVGAYEPVVEESEANPTADPTQEFPPELWFVERKAMEVREVVEFELASALNFEDVQLPRRQITANHCWFTYRGAYCNYVGPPVATILDAPTSDPDLDRCGKRLVSCLLREWPDGIANFGSYPAAALVRT